jgi:hypothetical protein
MRILKFAGAFLGTLLVIFLIVFGFNLNAVFTLFENQKGIQEGQEWVQNTSSLKGLTEYIGAQPQRVSVASVDIDNPDSTILYNPRTPRTMGRLSNIFLIIEYARQVEDGTLDPGEQIPLSKIDRYQLPYMDASAHDNAIESIRDSNAESGSDSTAALQDIVEASVAFHELAMADFLLYKVGVDKVETLLDELSIQETESPLPFSGLYIALNPHLAGRSTSAHFDSLSQLSRTEFSDIVFDRTEAFITDESYRERVVEQFENNEGLDIKFTEQRDALAFFPKTTAQEMANLMKNIENESLISPAVSKRVKSILGWPLKDGGRLTKDFKTYGAIYDSRMGMANGIDFGASTYSGEPFAQAVFFDELQVAFWFHMSSNYMHQDFQQRLIWDPALRRATVNEISGTKQDTSATAS